MANIELQKYLEELYTDIQAALHADEDGATQEEKFTEYIVDFLTEAGETDGVRLATYIKENKQEHIVKKINGFALSEDYETFDIFITHYSHTKNYYTLKKSELNRLMNRAIKFVNDGLKKGSDDIEESNAAYEASQILFHNRKKFVRLNIFILTNAQVIAEAPSSSYISSFEELKININIWDNERLFRLMQSKNTREPIELNFKNDFDYDIPCLEMPSVNETYDCYIAILPGELLSELYRNYGTKLLESNVRAFLQQKNNVNRGIKDTIRFNPEMFLTYNNGLAATAEALEIEKGENGSELINSITDFQIVNGGQTTASLFHTAKKWKESVDLDQVYVQMKLTVIKDNEKREEIVPLISRYANSQNRVSEVDLTSNNPFLQKIEKLSQKIYAIDPFDHNKQSLWFFERAKGQYKEALNREPTKSKKNAFKNKFPSNQKITKSELAKYINLWELEPHTVSKGAQKNYISFIKKIENKPQKFEPDKTYFEDLVANTILFRTTDKLFGNKKRGDNIGDTSIKSYSVNYTLAYFNYLTNNRLNLGKIWELQHIPQELKAVLYDLLCFVFDYLVNESNSLVSEFAKKKDAWDKLKHKNKKISLDKISYLLHSESSYNDRYFNNDKEDSNLKIVQDSNYIKELGAKFWSGLEVWGYKSGKLNSLQRTTCSNIANKIIKNAQLTENECERGMQIVDYTVELNLNYEDIKEISIIKKEIKPEYDYSLIYNRVKNISNKDWERIIQILDKTKKVDEKVISISKSVSRKALRGENISDRMLENMPKVLEIANKFGINV